jgi:hypothetical protein
MRRSLGQFPTPILQLPLATDHSSAPTNCNSLTVAARFLRLNSQVGQACGLTIPCDDERFLEPFRDPTGVRTQLQTQSDIFKLTDPYSAAKMRYAFIAIRRSNT